MTTTPHPLDRPVWNALTTGQAQLAIGDAAALRFTPDVHFFAAAADSEPPTLAALARLLSTDGAIGLLEAEDMPTPQGTKVRSRTIINQMVLTSLNASGTPMTFADLSDADAPEMLALATLTAPGPFFANTHRLGDFIGLRRDGRLVAMAGERTKPVGFTEVSAICTHPDHRGGGLARALMQVVIQRILARGEAAFLHVYPDNLGAITLYKALGFRFRRAMIYTVLERG